MVLNLSNICGVIYILYQNGRYFYLILVTNCGTMKVIELDPVVVDLAKKHFGFIEDQQMKVSVSLSLLLKFAYSRHQDE